MSDNWVGYSQLCWSLIKRKSKTEKPESKRKTSSSESHWQLETKLVDMTLTCKLGWHESSSSVLTTPTWPLLTAICSAVWRRLLRAFRSAPLCASTSITAGSSPKAAWCTARSPSLSWIMRRDWFKIIRLTKPRRPFGSSGLGSHLKQLSQILFSRGFDFFSPLSKYATRTV